MAKPILDNLVHRASSSSSKNVSRSKNFQYKSQAPDGIMLKDRIVPVLGLKMSSFSVERTNILACSRSQIVADLNTLTTY